MSGIRSAAPSVGGALLAVCLVAGCGGGSAAAGSPSGGSTSAPTAAPTGAPGQGFQNSPQFAAIRSCLQAAGISLPTRTGPRPSFSPGARPSGPRPSGPRPSGGFRGQGGGLFSDPKVRAALKACGITPPSPGSFRRPTGSAGASPTS